MSTYDDTTTAALLDAGAILPSGTTAREDADVLTARTYTHPALDGRAVVRLVPGTLGEAEDLALEFLGLAREPQAPEVGQVRRETLGFPAWALVHDPANGHHALALVKDVERLARQAKSKPGNAKEGFEALGERLGRAVPHFLPTFYEQAARIFLQHENTTYAAAFFGKAREAERVHALTVDEERQRAVFLEFAFAGALTVKALKEYVKDLARRLDGATAWAQFRQLTVERCAAGMPPYASLPQDARGLITAAGLDRVTEECALVADLLASPAAVRAPASFWNAYRSVLPVLVERRPALRTRLLEIMPAGLGQQVEDDEFWLTLLAECGADLLLTGDGGGEVDAADWLSRWAQHRKHGAAYSHRSPATLALVERMAARLRAGGRPVDLFTGRWQAGADLDLLDLCVAEGIALAVPDADTHVYLPLAVWLRDQRPGERDLKAMAAEPRHRAMLFTAVEGLGRGQGPAELPKVAAHPVLGEVLREWLGEAAAEFAADAGLPGADAKLERLRPFRAVMQEIPQAVRRLAEYDIVPVLGRTLRAGILDELGWPAVEEALELLDAEARGKDRDHELSVTEAWPALILVRGHKAVVVGPEGILLRHDLRLPTDLDRWQRPRYRYADGELLVMWRDGSKQHGYWSNRPSEVVVLGGEQIAGWWSGMDAANASIPLPGGGRATGGRTLHAGDTVLPPSRPVMGDGTTYWRQGRQGRQSRWLEYDPATGEHGRASLPALLASAVREDTSLLHDSCEVLPLQPGLEHSPFGTDGTVLGRWVRAEGRGAEARTTAGTPDGRTATLWAARNGRMSEVPLGVLRLPGGAGPIAAQMHRSVTLHAADGTELARVSFGESGGAYAAGTRLVPPVAFWHALRPRDERGSAVLRALTDAAAGELMRAAATALDERQEALARAGKDDRARAAVPTVDEVTAAAVAEALPELTDRRLRAGVAALVHAALRVAERATSLAGPAQERPRQPRQRTEGMFADYSPPHGGDRALYDAAAGVVTLQSAWHGGWAALRQIRAVNHVLSGRPADGRPLPESERLAPVGDDWQSDEHTIPRIGAEWPPVLGALRPLAYRACSPALTDVQREPLLLLFEALAEGPLPGLGATLRVVVLGEPHDKQQRAGQVLRRDGRTVVVLGCQSVDDPLGTVKWLALDHDPSGAFGAVGHFTLVRETRYPAGIPADRLAELTRLLREKGAAPWRPEAPEALASATNGALGPLQATVLLAGHPHAPGAEGLAVVGLKPRRRTFGAQLLNSLGQDEQRALLGALLPDDPAELWTTGPDTAAAGRVWAERLGTLVRLPEELSADLVGMGLDHAEAVLNPARTPWLARTTVFRPDKDGDLTPADPSAVPGSYALAGAVESLAALAYVLPYGHPLRAGLTDGLGALRRRLADPELLLDLNLDWTEKGGPTCVQLRGIFGLPESGGADAHGLTRAGDTLVLRPWYQDMEHVLLRPGGLSGADDPVLGLLEGLLGAGRASRLRAVRTLLGDDLARTLAAEGPEGYAQDPSVSVPALVAEVAEAHGLGADAAVLYLQLLALPDPTDRNCARWTGWKPARLKKARAELAATALVVEAKRPRAGRTLFLPGGWRDLRAPALPLETWKEALYPVAGGDRTLPLVPVREVFTRAWERVRAGDAPAYEQLTTGTARGGRRR
ncbi:hypothetical protein OHB00_44995 [Streptomyces sp. NBC_00631]|uniref:hypothetical protein n=1 Tax=Streptomyces sp. NBC_00631 TaxID=2975793 RepID=UPI0030E1CB3B